MEGILKLKRRHFNVLALIGLAAPAFAQTQSPAILVVGDSLSAEYGLKRGTGWVALLDERLKK
jgi:acyl-CoA thioesterase I